MPSDLATALISGNAPGIAADPMLASIAPQIQLAQTLSQQGLSTAPAYPAQALGRLAQTLAGVKMMHDATGELQGVYGHAAESMSRIFPDDTPLGRALRDPDPYARMIALQQASKAMLLQSEPQKLRGGDQVFVGSRPTAENTMPLSEPGKVTRDVLANPNVPRIAAGTAAQKVGAEESARNVPLITRAGGIAEAENPALIARAGGTESAKNPALISRAGGVAAAENPALIARSGGQAAAKAPYEGGGEGVLNGQTIPLTAATRAAMQPRTVPTVSVQRPPENIIGGGTGSPPPAAQAKQGPQAAAPASFDQRFGGIGGQPVKTPEFEGAVEGAKTSVKDFIDKSTPAYNAAQSLVGRLDIMDHNIDALGPKWMGAGANAKAEFGKTWNSMLDTAGVDKFHIDPAKIATWEEFNKESVRAGMELIKANFGGSREAASIIQMGTSAVPSAQQTYLGAKYNSASIRAAAQREIDLHEYKANLIQDGKSLIGSEATFNKTHPVKDYAMRGITSLIPPAAVSHLQANPKLATDFDKQFGSGTAQYLLGQK